MDSQQLNDAAAALETNFNEKYEAWRAVREDSKAADAIKNAQSEMHQAFGQWMGAETAYVNHLRGIESKARAEAKAKAEAEAKQKAKEKAAAEAEANKKAEK